MLTSLSMLMIDLDTTSDIASTQAASRKNSDGNLKRPSTLAWRTQSNGTFKTKIGGNHSSTRGYSHPHPGKRNGSLKLLITGASGLLGSKLVELALDAGHNVSSLYNEHPAKGDETIRVDLRDAEKVRNILTNHAPDAVIHTASITDVDFCER